MAALDAEDRVKCEEEVFFFLGDQAIRFEEGAHGAWQRTPGKVLPSGNGSGASHAKQRGLHDVARVLDAVSPFPIGVVLIGKLQIGRHLVETFQSQLLE